MRLSLFSLCFILGSTLILSSCQQEQIKDLKDLLQPVKDNIYKGPEVQVGNGQAQTFVTVNQKGAPTEVGVLFTAEALSGLPTQGTTYVLELHRKAIEATPFTHIVMGLSPNGHPLPPSGSIGPHFDVRFYTMTPAQRLSIPAPAMSGFPAGGGFDVIPPSGYMPANYVMNAAIAQLGRHWSESITTPGTVLTHTMVYGTWNGEVTFLTPNATLEAMRSGAKISVAYPQPRFFSEHGYYPTVYNIYKDEQGRHVVSLSHFVWR